MGVMMIDLHGEKNESKIVAGVSVNVARAFLVYGGLVTGPVTHYFYILLDRLHINIS